MPRSGIDVMLLDLIAKIEKHGWSVMGVFPCHDDPGVCFTYTVGLTAIGHPEMIIYGLDNRQAAGLLNGLATRVSAGLQISAGDRIDDLLSSGLALIAIAMTNTYDLAAVRRLYGTSEPALQIVWPDETGKMPWEPGYAMSPAAQPLYGEPPAPVTRPLSALSASAPCLWTTEAAGRRFR